ncbi:argininosuccinate synthase [Anaerofustis stercorihominis]|uniref:argininosuccinate synthase n=1 Tax=Anaerofustis stercorihominis TaxID=214853 RepID=UPI00267350CE|nr:argininosuccinate synthase [Anaerofustis stercorihominis]
MKDKIVLAYSGGLDTSTIVPWLKNNYDCEVHAVCVDVGQVDDNEKPDLEKRAIEYGADSIDIIDATEELVNDYIFPMLKSGGKYENKYLLGTSIARPLISKILVDKARELGANCICHGATGKGNDQVRFELTIMALAPDIKIIAPWRLWDIKSRQDALDYCIQHDIKLNMSAEESYSRDMNIWHLSHEGLELEDPANMPDYRNLLQMTTYVEDAPDEAEEISIEFEKGIPVSLNGEKMDGVMLLTKLNEIGGKHGIGVIDMVENRVVGMKSRGIYETPGGSILYYAHNELEQLCLDRETQAYKRTVAVKYADLVYSGMWFSPLREALDAFVDKTQETVTGKVSLRLYKGNKITKGIESPYSVYTEEIASFDTGELYDHNDAAGFIKLYGLPLKIRAFMKQNTEDK